MDTRRRLAFVLIAAVTGALVAGCQTAVTGDGGEDNVEERTDPGPLIEAWAESTHSVPVAFAAGRAPCAGCHDGRAFARGVDDPGRIDTRAPFGPYVVATDCRACHTGRGAELLESGETTIPTAQGPVKGGRGALCMACHNQWDPPDINDPERGYPHYGPQADVLNGTGGMTEGLTLMSTKKHLEVENTCVACHMADGAEGHTFRPTDTECKRCHEDFETASTIDARADYDGDGRTEAFVEEVDGLMDALYLAVNRIAETDEFFGESGAIVFKSDDETRTAIPNEAYMGAYNWTLIDHDKSRGLHNPAFTVTLLQESYRQMTGSEIPNAQKPRPRDGDDGGENGADTGSGETTQ